MCLGCLPCALLDDIGREVIEVFELLPGSGIGVVGVVVQLYKLLGIERETLNATLRALEAMSASSGGGKAARAAFEAVPGGPAAHEVLAQTYLPGRVATIKRLEPVEIDAGWRMERVEVTLAAVPWTEIATWLAKATGERPPWRLSAFAVEAASETAGSGTFTFECPVRK